MTEEEYYKGGNGQDRYYPNIMESPRKRRQESNERHRGRKMDNGRKLPNEERERRQQEEHEKEYKRREKEDREQEELQKQKEEEHYNKQATGEINWFDQTYTKYDENEIK